MAEAPATIGKTDAPDAAPGPPHTRIAVLFEPGRRGVAALARASELAAAPGVELTVVALAPQASGPRCGASNDAYNCAASDEAAAELRQAAELLGPLAERTRF
jgi:hypothetical protein